MPYIFFKKKAPVMDVNDQKNVTVLKYIKFLFLDEGSTSVSATNANIS